MGPGWPAAACPPRMTRGPGPVPPIRREIAAPRRTGGPFGAAAFETWLLAQQRHAAAASEAVLHEAALGSMARGALEAAIGYAVRAAAMSPLDENHQARDRAGQRPS
jgi:hypothetical protein